MIYNSRSNLLAHVFTRNAPVGEKRSIKIKIKIVGLYQVFKARIVSRYLLVPVNMQRAMDGFYREDMLTRVLQYI